jgi:uncharacterized protein YjbI with pentapeptide repeats
LTLLFVALSLSLATFPGEPLVNLFTGQKLSSVQCERWFSEKFDRLSVAGVDVVDDEKLSKNEESTNASGESPFQGERTRSFRHRDLNCGDFSDYADLRRVDFTGAQLRAAKFHRAKLHGASFNQAQLHAAIFARANLQGASLSQALINEANFFGVDLSGANLDDAIAKAAWFDRSQLQGASLKNAQLQGAELRNTQLYGALLSGAKLQGSSLDHAELGGAFLDSARLQGASLVGARLLGASLNSAFLQGAFLDEVDLRYAIAINVHVWNTPVITCDGAYFSKTVSDDLVVDIEYLGGKRVTINRGEAKEYINRAVSGIEDPRRNELTRLDLESRLNTGSRTDGALQNGANWIRCENTSEAAAHGIGHVNVLRDLVCNAELGRKEIAQGVIRNWTIESEEGPPLAAELARRLLEQDCAAAKDFSEKTRMKLRQLIADVKKR